jgi:hypothetical protein
MPGLDLGHNSNIPHGTRTTSSPKTKFEDASAMSDPIEIIRDLLDRGLHNQVVHEGRELSPALSNPSDQATLQVLIGRAEMFNGRLGPAVHRFRLAEYGDLGPSDRLQLGIGEAAVRFGSGGVAAVIEVIDELEANANDDNLTLAATAGLRAWTSLEQSNSTRAVELAKIANERALRNQDQNHDLIVLSWLVLGLSSATVGDVEEGAKALGSATPASPRCRRHRSPSRAPRSREIPCPLIS